MKPLFAIIPLLFFLSACTSMPWPDDSALGDGYGDTGQQVDPGAPDTDVAPVPAAARTVEEFDTTTAEQKAAAIAAAQSGGGEDLGLTIASLGSAGEPGFWLKTPLIKTPAKGRVVYPETGKSVEVDLIPIDGPKTAGSRMSLSAMRVVGAPFVGLPEIRVYRTGV